MRRRRHAHEVPEDLDELDPFLLSMIDRLATARLAAGAGDEWVTMDQVAALTARMAEAAQSALLVGWEQAAENRMLVESRTSPAGTEVRLAPRAREILAPVLGTGARRYG